MRRRTSLGLSAVAVAAAVFCIVANSHAATIHTQWTFEDATTPPDLSNSAVAPPALASTGIGTATGSHASALTDWSTPVGNGSPNSYSSNEWAIGDYYQFQTNTLGVGGVQLAWAQARSSTGPANFDLRWSTDGINYNTAMSYSLGTATFSSATFNPAVVFEANLQNIPALNNQAAVFFRLVATSAPSSTGGTSRVDDFTVIVPEPASLGMMVMAALGIVGYSRCRS